MNMACRRRNFLYVCVYCLASFVVSAKNEANIKLGCPSEVIWLFSFVVLCRCLVLLIFTRAPCSFAIHNTPE